MLQYWWSIWSNINKGFIYMNLNIGLCKNEFVDSESSRNDNMSLFQLQTSSLSVWRRELAFTCLIRPTVNMPFIKLHQNKKLFLKYLPKSSLYSNSFPWVTYSVNTSRSLCPSCALFGHRVRQSVGLGCCVWSVAVSESFLQQEKVVRSLF